MKRVSKDPLAIAMLLFLGATVCSANLISYTTWSANRDKVMVMDENGGDPVELFVGGKFSPLSAFPSISPVGLEKTWILFNDYYDLYRIRPNGSEQTLVLCGAGTDKFEAPYFLGLFGANWSPDGSEILVHPQEDFDSGGEGFLALIPASHTAVQAEICTSELVRIHEPPSPWTVDGGPAAWNHDGSRIAFEETNMETEQERLAVIERQASGVWQRIATIELIPGSPDLPDSQPYFLSWRPQAESDLLIFRLRGDAERRSKFWLAAIDLGTGVWDYVLDKGSRIEMDVSSSPSWSTDGNQILFTDPGGNLVKWTYPDGAREVVGSGDWAYWQRNVVVGVCGDDVCRGSETQCNCEEDCGEPPFTETSCTDLVDNDCFGDVDCDDPDCAGDPVCDEPYCGDGFCDLGEDSCNCEADCGEPPGSEASLCSDGVDNDCDEFFDCSDPDCADDTSCIGGLPGDPCTIGADCLSGLCHPKKEVCK